ncbi:MAG: hypothetical protein AAF090_03135 [Bacteroidota bacterium]
MNPYLISFFGAIAQEILHWYDLRQDFGEDSELNRTPSYWIITIAATILFTVATPWLIEGIVASEELKSWHYFIGALSFPAIVKKLVKLMLNINGQRGNEFLKKSNNYTTKKYFK